MNDVRTNIDNQGKILIPAKLRKLMNFGAKDTIILRYENSELKLINQKVMLRKIQEDFKKRTDPDRLAVDEFLEIKNEDRIIEENRINQLQA